MNCFELCFVFVFFWENEWKVKGKVEDIRCNNCFKYCFEYLNYWRVENEKTN